MKTVKVRIAVAVDPEGDWDARGESGQQDVRTLRALAYNSNLDRVYWLTAELPVPEAQEIAATVEEAKT